MSNMIHKTTLAVLVFGATWSSLVFCQVQRQVKPITAIDTTPGVRPTRAPIDTTPGPSLLRTPTVVDTAPLRPPGILDRTPGPRSPGQPGVAVGPPGAIPTAPPLPEYMRKRVYLGESVEPTPFAAITPQELQAAKDRLEPPSSHLQQRIKSKPKRLTTGLKRKAAGIPKGPKKLAIGAAGSLAGGLTVYGIKRGIEALETKDTVPGETGEAIEETEGVTKDIEYIGSEIEPLTGTITEIAEVSPPTAVQPEEITRRLDEIILMLQQISDKVETIQSQ